MIDRILETQRRSWLDGNAPPLESIFRENPGLRNDSSQALDLIYAEVLLREELGQVPTAEDYTIRFPDLTDQIKRQFQVHRFTSQENVGDTARASAVSDTVTSIPFPQIENFEVVEVAGRGGAGIVYRANDLQTGRVVAIKVLKTETTSDEALLREAETVASLNHPSIVDLYQVGDMGSARFLVMEYIDGGTLKEQLIGKPVPSDEAVTLMQSIVQAVQYAHSRGVIHRDIKTGNVLMSENGPKIGDFGLARRLDAAHTMHATGDVIGTPAYMSPEQAAGKKADASADIYSLGIVLYELLTGRPPFQSANPLEVLLQVISDEPVPLRRINSAIPKDLETICAKCLEKAPHRRYHSAAALNEDLERFRCGREILARPVGRFTKAIQWCRRNRPLTAALVLLLISLLAGSAVSTYKWIENARNATRAQSLAGNLRESQERMLDSVSRFQGRVFADEALYVQMSGKLRRELFIDVIDYLDEFARLPAKKIKPGAGDDITSQYLRIAEAALRTTDLQEAETAAKQALQRSRIQTAEATQNAVLWNQRSTAARLLAASNADAITNAEKEIELSAEVIQLFDEARKSAEQARTLSPDSDEFHLNYLVARWELLRRQHDAGQIDGVVNLRDELQEHCKTAGDEFRVDRLRTLVQMSLRVAEHSQTDEAFAQEKSDLTSTIEKLREVYRRAGKPNSDSQCMKGQVLKLTAVRQWKAGLHKEAIGTLREAETFFARAAKPAPNNRLWRSQLVDCQVMAATFLSKHDNRKARDKINEAIRNSIHLLEVDPSDYEMRQKVIWQLVAYGQYSEELGERKLAFRGYATANNDCNLLLFDPERMNWAWKVKLYCTTKTVEYETPESRAETVRTQLRVLDNKSNKYGLDASPALEAIDQRKMLEKPACLDAPLFLSL